MPDQPEPKRAIQLEPPAAEHARQRNAPRYAELHCLTNFSFLEGASHPDELVARAAELGYAALAITDRHTLAGVVRAHGAAKQVGLKLLIGAEIAPLDAPPVILWATDRAAYGRLARLITRGRRNAPKGECRLTFADLAEHAAGLLAGVLLDGSVIAAATGRDSSVAEASDLGSPSSSVAGLSEAGSSVPSPRYSGERARVRGGDAGDVPTSASPESQLAPSPSSGPRPPSPRNGEKDPEDRPHRGRLQKTEDEDALIPSPRY
ncbi:MAG: PHP domain-containing protein, partial [Planctomycetaceae bacterium]|nr:PHP domain-containing protein [Planctomycetaceae bacterium]